MSAAGGDSPDDDALDDALFLLVEEFTDRVRKGERPSVEDYAARHPALATFIRDLFPAIVLVEKSRRCASPPDSPPVPSPLLEGSGSPSEPFRLGDYRIVREIGRGGMGIVYEAVQESLGRRVALKLLPGGLLQDPRRLSRFQREAWAAGTLQHPNIVTVHGVGEEAGNHYYVMQFIEGEGLDRVIADLRRRRGKGSPEGESAPEASPAERPDRATDVTPLREHFSKAARLGLQVAEGLASAHGQGIIHRDIKPSNLLLDKQGKVWITDFGLAKSEESEDLTKSGELVGTLHYMAPERFKGWSDPRSDVYSLGLVLYEIITLEPAFADEDRSRLLRRIIEEEPRRPRRIERSVPRDLETIVLKAIAKEPGQRYVGAADLAEDLRRFLAGEPIRARQSGAFHRCVKWARRRPAAAALVAVVFLAVSTMLAGGILYNARLRQENIRTRRNLTTAMEVVEKMIVQVSGFALDPQVEPIRMEMLAESLKYFEGFLREAPGDPQVAIGAARIYAQVGQVYALHGRRTDGGMALRKSIEILESLNQEVPRNEEYRKEQAIARSIAGLFETSALPPAAEMRRIQVPGSTNCVSVAVGDFDGDGTPDLAVAGRASNNVAVLRNSGSRHFEPMGTFPTGIDPYGILTVDIDKDGSSDAITINRESKTVSVLLNDQKGSLRSPVTCQLDFEPFGMVAADLDGDGRNELAVSGGNPLQGERGLRILKRAPGGDLAGEVVSGLIASVNQIVAADFDQDGRLDLAVGYFSQYSSGAGVAWNEEGGRFSTSTLEDTGYSNSLLCGDVNGDGRPDLIPVSHGYNTVSVVLNAGKRRFEGLAKLLCCSRPFAVGLADLDGDERMDLLLSNETEGVVSILLGDGKGLFNRMVRFETGGWPFQGCIADLDGDDRLDIAIANGEKTNDIAVMFHVANLLALPKGSGPAGRPGGK